MNADDFEKVLKNVLSQTEKVLGKKAGEYATDADRLHNFKSAAVLRGSNEAQALGGMMVKHTISVYDMINSGRTYPREMWDEKIGDHINYLVLLRAIVEEWAQADDELDICDPDEDALNNSAPEGFEGIRFKTRKEGEDVIQKINDVIALYGQLSISSLYDIVGIATEANLSDSRWGWQNVSTANLVRERNGYSLRLPLPKFLHGVSSTNSE